MTFRLHGLKYRPGENGLLIATLLEALQREGRSGALLQQPLQAGAIPGFDAYSGYSEVARKDRDKELFVMFVGGWSGQWAPEGDTMVLPQELTKGGGVWTE